MPRFFFLQPKTGPRIFTDSRRQKPSCHPERVSTREWTLRRIEAFMPFAGSPCVPRHCRSDANSRRVRSDLKAAQDDKKKINANELLRRAAAAESEALAYNVQVPVQFYACAERTSTGPARVVIAEILEADDIALLRSLKLLGFRNGILRPVQIDAAEITLLGSQCSRSFFRLVTHLHPSLGVHIGDSGIDQHGGEEVLRLDHPVPLKRIPPIWVSGDADGIGSSVHSGFQGVERSAMFVTTHTPKRNHAKQRQSCAKASLRPLATHTNFLVDQGEERGQRQTCGQHDKQDRLYDENNVPGIPFLGKGPERTYAIVNGEDEHDVGKAGEIGIEEQKPPPWRQIGIVGFASTQAPDQVHEAYHCGRYQRDPDEGVREAAMMGKPEDRTLEIADHIEIRRFRCQR